MSRSIFISHATKDKELARAVVDFLEQGMGVPENEIFCSSLPEFGIPTGENFVSYMKGQMQKPVIVLLLLTPSYFKSNFCLCEMGAAWGMSHKIFPIIVPPLDYDDVKDVLLGTQVMKLDDDLKYNEIRDFLKLTLELNVTSGMKWDTKRKSFLKQLPALLSNLAIPQEISSAEHDALRTQVEDAKSELMNNEEEILRLKKLVKRLETAKDKQDVQKIKNELAGGDISQKAESILSEISALRSSCGGKEVFKFLLCDHYDKPYKIDWFAEQEQFDNAVRRNLISCDDGERANWSNKILKKLKQSLDSLDRLVISDEDGVLQLDDDEHMPDFEPDSQEFWSYHYGI